MSNKVNKIVDWLSNNVTKVLNVMECLFAAIFVVLLCWSIHINLQLKDEHTTTIVEIESLSLGTGASGSFHLGTGTLDSEVYYIVIKKEEDGAKTLFKVNAEISRVYDILKDGEKPYIEVISDGYGKALQYNVYIPVGSVTEKYDFMGN